jgi:predicted kinase
MTETIIDPSRLLAAVPLPPGVIPRLPEVIILSGLSGAGKSQFANAWVLEDPRWRQRINYDLLRENMGPFTHKQEREVKTKAMEMAREALIAGRSIIVDNMNLSENARMRWVHLAKDAGITPAFIEIDTPVRECVSRDRMRVGKGRVGRAVVERQALFHGFIDWDDRAVYPFQRFVVVDVDGTLADAQWRIDLYTREKKCLSCDCPPRPEDTAAKKCQTCGSKLEKDWQRCFAHVDKDQPHYPIVELVQYLGRVAHILIVSGRPIDPCGIPTEEWLQRHKIPVTHLFMRNGSDNRPDTIVKGEIADLLPLGKVKMVIDDRPSVLRMWRSHGFTTLGVGPLEEF